MTDIAMNHSIRNSRIFNDFSRILASSNLDGYIFSSTDEYQNEYIAECDNRIKYLTAFSGSFAIVIVFQNEGYFFTDGRYLTQAQNQIDVKFFKIHNIKELAEFNWPNYVTKLSIGYNSRIFTPHSLKYFPNLQLLPDNHNLFDQIWYNRPAASQREAFIYSIEYSGQSHKSKLDDLRKIIINKNAKTLLLTNSESICWLLNIRGHDMDFCPLLNAYASIHLNQLEVFTNLAKVSKSLIDQFDDVEFFDFKDLEQKMKQIEDKILIDEQNTSVYLLSLLDQTQIENTTDPCLLMRAIKNDTEINLSIQIHIYDAKAICETITKIKLELEQDIVISEHDISLVLKSERSKNKNYLCESFAAICGYKENAAIIHYRAEKNNSNNKILKKEGLLLIDSGGHYLGGTTDVTRTIALGDVTTEQRILYTNVLKGHIALAKSIFLQGSNGANLDILARQFLWQHGYDYPHGTGHGVGNLLNVHEGPHSINQRNTQILKKNMIISNEPGFYCPNDFGIRIENLLYIAQSKYTNFLCFKNLTLLPYDKELINLSMLENNEIEYLKQYYLEIDELITPLLSSPAKAWLRNELSIFL